MNEFILVITTTETKEDCEKIAEYLVKKRLAGCIQVFGPISSTFWWKNKIDKSNEWICFIKSKKELYNNLEKSIKKIHPYDTPEIIAIPILLGSNEYLGWLNSELMKL